MQHANALMAAMQAFHMVDCCLDHRAAKRGDSITADYWRLMRRDGSSTERCSCVCMCVLVRALVLARAS